MRLIKKGLKTILKTSILNIIPKNWFQFTDL